MLNIAKLFIIITLIILLFSPKEVLALFEFSSSQNTISDTDELTINIELNLASSTANNSYYLRGAFYKETTTKYFGYTLNNQGESYNGPYSDCANLFKVTVNSEGDWSGEIKVKADPEDSAFDGTDEYLFKVGRYTESCSNTWSDSEPIKIHIAQTVFPSPSPSSDSNENSSSSNTSKSSSSPKSTPKSNSKKSPSPTPVVLSTNSKNSGTEQPKIEDSISQVDPNQFNAPSPAPQNQGPSKKFAGVLMGSGTLLISMSIIGYLFYKRQERHPAIHKEKNRFEKED